MPGRSFQADKAAYGFNGKRKDNDIYGEGNAYDFGERIQDPRLGGRFFSLDPLFQTYPGNSPYLFASNSPIQGVDEDGLRFRARTSWSSSARPVFVNTRPIRLPSSTGTSSTPNYYRGMYVPGNTGQWVDNGYGNFRYYPSSAEVFEMNKEAEKQYKTGLINLANSQGDVIHQQLVRNAFAEHSTPLLAPSFENLNISPSNDPNNSNQKTNDDFVYRSGSSSDLNFTPAMKDAGTDAKSGLSTFTDPLSATQGEGGKVQVLSTKILKGLGFILTNVNGHVGIRPKSQKALEIWAKTKEDVRNGKEPHLLTKILKKARVGEISLPKEKKKK